MGTCTTRNIAASFYNEETYFLQIDGHTIFRPMWDVILKANYKELAKKVEKPIISSYVPYWYRDKNTGKATTMNKDENFDKSYPGWGLVAKTDERWHNKDIEKFKFWAYNVEGCNSPAALPPDYTNYNYEEQYLTSGHFLFSSGNFIKEVPYDPLIRYHEENVTPMRAWTRGYRIFNIKDHVLWTREMQDNGRDNPDSWRSTMSIKNLKDSKSMQELVTEGALRNKDILTGKIFGLWGAPDEKSLLEYISTSKIDYNKFYEDMYKEVEETGDKYVSAKFLYDLEKSKGLKNNE